jgi:predicted nucleic acid-binding protein
MEIMHGMKSNKEFRIFQKQISVWNTDIIQIEKEISSRAMFYIQEYRLRHSMMLADAFIAATVVQNSEKLFTAKEKHYKFIPNIECLKFKPGQTG